MSICTLIVLRTFFLANLQLIEDMRHETDPDTDEVLKRSSNVS